MNKEKILHAIPLVLCFLLVCLLVNRYNYASRLETENKELKKEISELNEKVESLQDDEDWVNQAKILVKLEECLSTGDYAGAVQLFLENQDAFSDTDIYKQAKKIFEQAKEKIEDEAISSINDLINQ